MKVLPLCLLLFINYSFAICDYGFNRPMNRQFVESIERHFTTYEMFLQGEVRQAVDSFVHEERGRKEMLRHLMDAGYLAIENSPNQNRLFSDILDKPPEEVIKAIKENPESLYEGTLLNLPPFFLVVFVGEKEVMDISVQIDRRLVDSRNTLQDVPLHYTLDSDMATGLFFHNAKPNEPNKKGRVPLYDSRDPDTVRVMLYYNANPMVRDRSGISLIRYHKEQVGNQEIVDLLEQARESQKSVNSTRNKKPVVHQKTEEEIRTEEERRLAGERRRAEEVRAEQEKAEKRRLSEERRIARRAEAEEANRRMMEERKSRMLSNLADVMASAMMAKAIVAKVSSQTVDLKMFSNVESTLQSVQRRSSNIIIYEKEFEDNFAEELGETIKGIVPLGKSMEEFEKIFEDVVIDKTQDMEKELLAKLTEEIGHYSLGKIRGMLNKTGNYYARFIKMMNQLARIRVAQGLVIEDVIREVEGPPEETAAVLRRERGDLMYAIPFR